MPKPRKPAVNALKRRLRIYCEGEKSEPSYLDGYINLARGAERKKVVRIEPTRKNTPVQLVDEAILAKKSPASLPNDVYWVVYDRESTAKYPDALHAQAYDRAMRNGINVAINNVCFEYWLILHFETTDAPYSSYDDLRNQSCLNPRVKTACGKSYEKALPSLFSAIKAEIGTARIRGAQVNKSSLLLAPHGRQKPFELNPYVGMVDLLNAIDDFD